MVLGIDLLDNLGQRALLVENKCTAECADAGLTAELLLAPRAERLQHLGRGVGQEREWQRVLVDKLAVRARAILAYAHHVITSSQKRIVVVAQVARLGCTAAGIVLRIEIDDGLFADKVGRGDLRAVLVYNLEVRHFISNFQHSFMRFLFVTLR